MWNVDKFDAIRISVASPQDIRKWSFGEIKKPETINYRTHKPERDGLFCERIFGPTHDWTCACGKYKSIRYKGIKCERCGVEITRAKVRRERMGNIELASPVAHIWYSKGTPNYMALLLDISPKDLEKVIYFNSYIVLDPGNLPLMHKQLLTEKEYRTYVEKYGDLFVAKMGAEAVKELLASINLDEIVSELKFKLNETPASKRPNIIKRLEVAETFMKSSSKPENMILECIPVIPPDLRPMVQLDGGRFATSDLNDLYRRVINRNNRLKKLIELGAPEIIIKNEKRMLQEAVNSLIDNGRRGRPVTGPGKRPLKSLNDMLKGKQGRFRQNLLGKRVDYSGRSVIVVGPTLKLHQCGLPKKMALELFKPFIMNKLVSKGIAHNIKSAKKMLERGKGEVWDLLEEVIHHHPVMLNRAPTLHRLGIQAFEPVLVEGKAIKIPPLVCKPFNADFDGDQMAVHVPLLIEAQAEARILMLSSHNIFSPASGKPLMSMDQDMALGCFYLTRALEARATRVVTPKKHGKTTLSIKDQLLSGRIRFKSAEVVIDPKTAKDDNPKKIVDRYQQLDARILDRLEAIKCKEITIIDQRVFSNTTEMELAFEQNVITLHEKHWVRINGDYIETCYGRVVFNNIVPEELGFQNRQMARGQIGKLVTLTNEKCRMERTARLLDDIKILGFKYATISGVSFSLSDLRVPKRKAEIINNAQRRSEDNARRLQQKLINREEKRQNDIDTWQQTTLEVTDDLVQEFKRRDDAGEFNSVYMMSISGARGNMDQVRQLSGMRGLMSNPKGDVIDYPIKSNFRDGLTMTEYFISTYGARKGLVDTALRTADSGYLTRRLVDVSQDVIIREHDCLTEDGILVLPLRANRKANNMLIDEVVISLSDRLTGRIAAADVVHPNKKDILVRRNEIITSEIARTIELAEVPMPVSQELIGYLTADMILEERTGKIIARPDLEINQFLLDHLHGNRIEVIKVKPRVVLRSPLNCRSTFGICQMCYSQDLSTGRLVEIGETAGIIAAQSIGEPGTQLTMRTFHIGGIALAQKLEIKTKISGSLDLLGLKWTYKVDRKKQAIGDVEKEITDDSSFDKDTRRIVLEGSITVRRSDGREDTYSMPTGGVLDGKVADGEQINAGEVLCQYNPNIVHTQFDGTVKFETILEKDGIVVSQDGKVIIEQDGNPLETYKISQGSTLKVVEGDAVDAGDVLAEKATEQQAAISGITGRTEFKDVKIKNVKVISDSGIIYVTPEDPKEFKMVEYELPQGVKEFKEDSTTGKFGVKLRVRSGNQVKANDELLVVSSEIDGKVKLQGKKTILLKKDNTKIYEVPKDMEMMVDDEKQQIIFVTDVPGKVKVLQPKSTTNKTLGGRRILVTEEKEYHVPLDANLLPENLQVKPSAEIKAGTQICGEISFKTSTDGVVEITSETRKVLDAPIEIGLVEKTLPRERTVMLKKLTVRNVKDLNLSKDSALKDKIIDKILAAPITIGEDTVLLEEGEKVSGEFIDQLLLISPIGGYVKVKNEIEVKNLNAPNLKYYLGREIARDVLNVKTGQVVAKEGQLLDNQLLVDFDRNQLELGPVFVTGTWITVSNEFTLALRDIAPIRDKLLGKITKSDVFSPATGELMAMANQMINKDLMELILSDSSIKKIELIDRKIFEVPEGAQIKIKDGAQIKAGTELIMPTHLSQIKVIHKIEEYEVPQEIDLLVTNGEEVLEGQMLTKPIPAIVSEINGKINCITKYNKKTNLDVITKITVYSGKEYEIPDGIPIKVKNGEVVETLTPLTGPIEFQHIEEDGDIRRIIRTEHLEKKYKITPEMEVLVHDGQDVEVGDKLAVLCNYAFESEKAGEEMISLNRRNIGYLRHYPVVPGKIKIFAGKKEIKLFDEYELAKIKDPSLIVGKRINMTVVNQADGNVVVEAENILDEADAKAIIEQREDLNITKARFYEPGLNINYTLGEVSFDDRPANEMRVEYIYEEPGVVKLKHRETKEGKKRTTIGTIVIQSGEAHQILDGAELRVDDGQLVKPGDILAKWGSSSKKTIDIIQGLPRVAELFEARKPKKEAITADFEGIIRRSGNNLYLESPTGERKHYKGTLGVSSNFIVFDGELVRAGISLTDGNVAPKKLHKTAGVEVSRRYLVDEVQQVYRSQGVEIDDKHLEVIVRQMLRKIKIARSGDTRFLPRETVTISEFLKENDRVLAADGMPAEGEQILQGITKASLTTDSFISAASFQETTRVLTQASIRGKVDRLRGLKENLIIGKLIPAGTGINAYRDVVLPAPRMAAPASMDPENRPIDDEALGSEEDILQAMTGEI